MAESARTQILLFAAGASRRMGGNDKLLREVGKVSLLVHVARRAIQTGYPVTVLLPPDRPEREQALEGLPVRQVTVANAVQGMSASIRAGIAALPFDAPGAMFLMADMPDLRGKDLQALLRAFEAAGCAQVIRAAAADGAPGSPAVVPRRLFGALSELSGDRGGRDLLRGEETLLVRLPGRRALTDLDTPEDWDTWRAASRD